MKNKFVSPLLSAVVLLTSQAVLASLPPKPEACPTISAIQAVGVNHAANDGKEWMAFSPKNYFGTKEEWTFVMLFEENFNNEKEAIEKANKVIPTLSLYGNMTSQNDHWACAYFDGQSHGAVIITPSDFDIPQMKSMYKFHA